MGLSVIAEAVEDAATLQNLRALGCDKAQGYHIASPLTMAALSGKLDNYQEQLATDAQRAKAHSLPKSNWAIWILAFAELIHSACPGIPVPKPP